jgi:hypothetical protein
MTTLTNAARRPAAFLDPATPLRLARALAIALPAVLMYGRGLGDVMICTIDVLFLIHSATSGGWGWLRRGWVVAAGAWWAWMVAVTLAQATLMPVVQAVVTVRLLLFVAACEAWVLPDARTGKWLAWVFAGCAAWIALGSWEQLLTGTNMFGVPKGDNGVVTGPFAKPHTGQTLEAVFFPAVLPFVIAAWQGGRGWRDRAAALALLAVAMASLVVIGQRMPLLLVLFGLLIAAALLPALRRPVGLVVLLCAAGIAALPVLSPETFGRLVVLFDQQMSHFWASSYGQIYERALVMVQAHPWFGQGFLGFRLHCHDARFVHGLAFLGASGVPVDDNLGCNIHPHSTALELLTSFGIPGLLLFWTMAGLWIARSLRGWRPAAQPLRSAVVIALLVWLWPISARSSVFVIDAGGWLFFTAGWALALARLDERAG